MTNLIRLLLFFIFFTGIEAFAQVKHIVIDMENVIVREVPSRKASEYESSSLVKVKESQYSYTLYHQMAHVAQAFMRLQKENSLVVHVLTDKKLPWAQEILSSFILKKPFEQTLSMYFGQGSVNKIISAEDLNNGVLNLNKITSDTDNILVVTNNLKYFGGKDSPNRVSLPRTLYYFNSFKEAAAEKAHMIANGTWTHYKDFVPQTENEWANEHFKIAALMARFIQADIAGKNSLVRSVKEINAQEQSSARVLGIRMADRDFSDTYFRWTYSSSGAWVTGCETYNERLKRQVKTHSLSVCQKELGASPSFNLNSKSYKVEKCYLKEHKRGAILYELKQQDCLAQQKLSYYWTKVAGQNICASFVEELFFLKRESHNKCDFLSYEVRGGVPQVGFNIANITGLSIPKAILSLEHREQIPSNLYIDYSVNKLAQSLILRKHRLSENQSIRDFHYDFINDTKIAIAFSEKYAAGIISKGFLNQHQIKRSNGAFAPVFRADLEDRLIGHELSPAYRADKEKVNRLRPKYAFLIMDKIKRDMGLNSILPNYGNIYAILNKSAKSRSTFTAGDSLDMRATYKDAKTFFFRSRQPLKLRDVYFEAQIWGELDMKDVNHFLVNCSHTPNISQNTISLLKRTGLPVHQCKTEAEGSYPYKVYKGARL